MQKLTEQLNLPPMMSGRLILLEPLELLELEVEVGLTFERVLVRTVPVFNGLPVASGNSSYTTAAVNKNCIKVREESGLTTGGDGDSVTISPVRESLESRS